MRSRSEFDQFTVLAGPPAERATKSAEGHLVSQGGFSGRSRSEFDIFTVLAGRTAERAKKAAGGQLVSQGGFSVRSRSEFDQFTVLAGRTAERQCGGVAGNEGWAVQGRGCAGLRRAGQSKATGLGRTGQSRGAGSRQTGWQDIAEAGENRAKSFVL